jgi:hypothetical protein
VHLWTSVVPLLERRTGTYLALLARRS